MLKTRSRPVHKEQFRANMLLDSSQDLGFSSDGVMKKARNSSIFSLPGLFVGFSTKGLSDCDSARSPTSPLDFKVFSNLGNFFAGSPRSPGLDKKPKNFDCNKVGLGLVDSLNDETTSSFGKVLGSTWSKNILFGSQMSMNIPRAENYLDGMRGDLIVSATKSLPKDCGFPSKNLILLPNNQSGSSMMSLGSNGGELEHGEFGRVRSCSANVGGFSSPLTLFDANPKSSTAILESDSNNSLLGSPPLAKGGIGFDRSSSSLPVSIGSSHNIMGSLSASEIEQSEDYTCIISHGPNPKTTHIFGDYILGSDIIQLPEQKNRKREEEQKLVNSAVGSLSGRADDFLSLCFSCKKKLGGEDIYIYRGEKAFCSCDCRDQEILIEEEKEKNAIESPDLFFDEDIFLTGMVVAS
ncbi:FCS-Like Zinc finger 10-like [Typha latifolia]|uniref:FCS-Like Zinc finger 10-like n=1 Tax=Typha latifolia TaxID=4733 RepID=UPI003C2FF17A